MKRSVFYISRKRQLEDPFRTSKWNRLSGKASAGIGSGTRGFGIGGDKSRAKTPWRYSGEGVPIASVEMGSVDPRGKRRQDNVESSVTKRWEEDTRRR